MSLPKVVARALAMQYRRESVSYMVLFKIHASIRLLNVSMRDARNASLRHPIRVLARAAAHIDFQIQCAPYFALCPWEKRMSNFEISGKLRLKRIKREVLNDQDMFPVRI